MESARTQACAAAQKARESFLHHATTLRSHASTATSCLSSTLQSHGVPPPLATSLSHFLLLVLLFLTPLFTSFLSLALCTLSLSLSTFVAICTTSLAFWTTILTFACFAVTCMMALTFGVMLVVTLWVGCVVGSLLMALAIGLIILRVGERVGSAGFGRADRFISNVMERTSTPPASSIDTAHSAKPGDPQPSDTILEPKPLATVDAEE